MAGRWRRPIERAPWIARIDQVRPEIHGFARESRVEPAAGRGAPWYRWGVSAAWRLRASALRRRCRPAEIPFETTAEVTSAPGIVGQERAAEALRFGSGLRRPGYNLFVVGPPGVGKHTLLQQSLTERGQAQATPGDWCYVHNFAEPARPRAIELSPGQGASLRGDMKRAVEELRDRLRAAFESEEFRTRRQRILDRLEKRQQDALSEVQERARRRGVAVLQTPGALGVAPMRGGSAMSPQEFGALPKSERDERQAEMDSVGKELQGVLHRFHDWEREHRDELRALEREMAQAAARRALAGVRASHAATPAVREHLDAVENDIVERAGSLLEGSSDGEVGPHHEHGADFDESVFDRYRINLLVDRRGENGAPVVREDHPSYANLVGRIEHEARFGTLVTHVGLLKGGALHRAIGGYLILDALKVLQNPLAWEALKRTLNAGEIRIESPDQALGFLPVVSLRPQPIPLGDLKLVLTGDRLLYYQLAALDPEFTELFKVLVDFEEEIDRDGDGESTYASLIAGLVSKEALRPFDRGAVARVIDHAVRLAGDAYKLSVHMRSIVDLLREADYWAGERGREVATAADVREAIDAQRTRGGRIRERIHEAIRREDRLVSTEGARVGQVNGLTVLSLGDQMLGHPTRITARTRTGRGELLDIEREVELGGPIHSKGVLILGGLLGSRYAPKSPLSLAATLVFEQSYGPVEGDSASLAELCALLSALSEVPLRQSIAITGSVNQQGDVQSVGGVNEKIEGFFDVCRERGLTGEQGVVIPRTNAKNLMLREDVVEAAETGSFQVYAVQRVDEAVELLTDMPAGERDERGRFEDGSVNALVERRLEEYAAAARAFSAGSRNA